MNVALECPVITVGGTNGKGSVCAMLEAMLRAGGYRTGLYTSPHLERYNERVRIAGVEASDDALCASFQAVEAARGDVALTYFEYGTLGALWLLARERIEAAVLEVGLGGGGGAGSHSLPPPRRRFPPRPPPLRPAAKPAPAAPAGDRRFSGVRS